MRFAIRNWFLLLLVTALVSGCWAWRLAEPLLGYGWLRDGVVAAVLFAMALPLDSSTLWEAVRRPWASLLAIVVNMGAVPLITWALAWIFPTDLRHGLLVAAATPCTLASASVWTRRAGGNDAVSLIVTVVTNLFCFVVTPFWLWIATGQYRAREAVAFTALGRTLAFLVVVPMVMAQLLRLIPRIAHWSSRRKILLNTLAQGGILVMVFLGSIHMGRMLANRSAAAVTLSVLGTVLVVVLIHLMAFALGIAAGRMLGLSRADRIAVGFAGSQKTLMVGIRVSLDLGASILPMVAYHVAQLILDTLLVDYWFVPGRRQHQKKRGTVTDDSAACAGRASCSETA